MAGFLPHRTDKATFGGARRVELAENEEACARIGWPPMSMDQGFQAGDNALICVQKGFIGDPVSERIKLPARWLELLG